jgi:hypothetical protein
MPVARVVSFEGVSKERMDEMRRELEGQERPEGVPATELVVLHDPESEKVLVVFFFENDEDYRQGDATLNAMPTADTPGRRTAVDRYDVAMHMTG